jgi:hypothetical protein
MSQYAVSADIIPNSAVGIFSHLLLIIYSLFHRVGRVLSFFSSRRNWDSPTPLAAGECAPPPFGPGGGNTRLQQKGWGSHNSEEVTYTVVLYVYKYFVVCLQQCCGSGMLIPDGGSRNQKQQQREGYRKICSPTFFVATNITKLKIFYF